MPRLVETRRVAPASAVASGPEPEAPPAPAWGLPPAPEPEALPAPTSELPPTPEPQAPPAPASATPDWYDLAQNVPGQGVRQEQLKTWEESKSRSKVLAYGARVFDVHTDERAWRKGAEGEETVGAMLNKLRAKGWYVLHSVPVGKGSSDIDHVVIGPGGVFTINTKNHVGKKIWVADYAMMVGGTKVDYLRNAKFEAERTVKFLRKHLNVDVPVRGCVVVLTGTFVPEVTYKSRPVAAAVLTKWDIPRWFRKQPKVLTPEQVEAIYAVARRSTTWV